jgi:mRNA interferase MazF
VVQDDVFNRSRVHTVIVCALTTNLRRGNEPGNVTLEPGEGDLATLRGLLQVGRQNCGCRLATCERQARICDALRSQHTLGIDHDAGGTRGTAQAATTATAALTCAALTCAALTCAALTCAALTCAALTCALSRVTGRLG